VFPPARSTRHRSAARQMGYYVVSDGTAKPYRVHMRNPLRHAAGARNHVQRPLLADVVAVIGSIDIVLGEIDR
jgi:NADH-quinone oxidoreductase subunit D